MKKIIFNAALLLCSTLTASNQFDTDTEARKVSPASSVIIQSDEANTTKLFSFKVLYSKERKTDYNFSVYFGTELCFEGYSSFTIKYSPQGGVEIGYDFKPLTQERIIKALKLHKAELAHDMLETVKARNTINVSVEHAILEGFTEMERSNFLSLCKTSTK